MMAPDDALAAYRRAVDTLPDALTPRQLDLWQTAHSANGYHSTLGKPYLDAAWKDVSRAVAESRAAQQPAITDADREAVAFLRAVFPDDSAGMTDAALAQLIKPYHRAVVRAFNARDADTLFRHGIHFSSNKGTRKAAAAYGLDFTGARTQQDREDRVLLWAGHDPSAWRAAKAREAEAEAAVAAEKDAARRAKARLDKWGPDLVAWVDDPDKGYNVTPRMLASFRNKQWRYDGGTYWPDALVKQFIAEGREFKARDRRQWSKRKDDYVTKHVYEAWNHDEGTFNDLSKSEYLFATWLQSRS